MGLEESDHSVPAIPDTIACAPDFVRIDFATAGKYDDGVASLSLSDSWATGGNRVDGGARVRSGNFV